jgi:hypothetical protein
MPTKLASILGALDQQKAGIKAGIPAWHVHSHTSTSAMLQNNNKRQKRSEATALLPELLTRETISRVIPTGLLIGVK